IANLAGAGGSAFFRARASHIQAKTGASTTTKIGCTNWNQLAGNSHPNRWRSVLRSPKRFSEEPACSNGAQKIAEATTKTKTAAERFRSSGDQPPKKISQENTTAEIPSRHQPRPSEIVVAVSWMAPDAASNPKTASAPRPAATATIAFRFCRRSRSGSQVLAGCSPAFPK